LRQQVDTNANEMLRRDSERLLKTLVATMSGHPDLNEKLARATLADLGAMHDAASSEEARTRKWLDGETAIAVPGAPGNVTLMILLVISPYAGVVVYVLMALAMANIKTVMCAVAGAMPANWRLDSAYAMVGGETGGGFSRALAALVRFGLAFAPLAAMVSVLAAFPWSLHGPAAGNLFVFAGGLFLLFVFTTIFWWEAERLRASHFVTKLAP
jgi:hypothetical protein